MKKIADLEKIMNEFYEVYEDFFCEAGTSIFKHTELTNEQMTCINNYFKKYFVNGFLACLTYINISK